MRQDTRKAQRDETLRRRKVRALKHGQAVTRSGRIAAAA